MSHSLTGGRTGGYGWGRGLGLGMGRRGATQQAPKIHTVLAHIGHVDNQPNVPNGGGGVVHKVSLSFIASVALPPPPRLDQRYETEPGRPSERTQISQNH